MTDQVLKNTKINYVGYVFGVLTVSVHINLTDKETESIESLLASENVTEYDLVKEEFENCSTPYPAGLKIANSNDPEIYGTLGGFSYRHIEGSPKQLCVLTARHVTRDLFLRDVKKATIFGRNFRIPYERQIDYNNEEYDIAAIIVDEDFENTINCINKTNPVENKYNCKLFNWSTESCQMSFQCFKCGATTGKTIGKVNPDLIKNRTLKETFLVYGNSEQICAKGDSGSFVMFEEKNEEVMVLGMVVQKDKHQNKCMAQRLNHSLKKLTEANHGDFVLCPVQYHLP